MTGRDVGLPIHRLEIYIGSRCENCATACDLARTVESWGIPALQVHVVDLDQPNASRPGKVFAVPTYVFDDQVISLGNPTEAELLALLRRRIGGPSCR